MMIKTSNKKNIILYNSNNYYYYTKHLRSLLLVASLLGFAVWFLVTIIVNNNINNNDNNNASSSSSSTSSIGGVVVITKRIAFIGNSFQFANDLPRFLQALVESNNNNNNNNNHDNDHYRYELYQDSTLHGNLSLVSILEQGNGMYYRWRSNTTTTTTSNDENDENEYEYDKNGDVIMYDYGCCTIKQLLLGYDEALETLAVLADKVYDDVDDEKKDDNTNFFFDTVMDNYYNNDDDDDDDNDNNNNNNNAFPYSNDGNNPCFQDLNYLKYTLTKNQQQQQRQQRQNVNNNATWDFVVLNDQSMRPANPTRQAKTVQTLLDAYAPMFIESGATPVFIATYGYWRPDLNEEMTKNYVDVPTFTYMLHLGYQNYVDELSMVLPSDTQKPLLAPVGMAFLLIWEENHTVWKRLFQKDYYHPSTLGTYLIGCVLHSTIWGIQAPVPFPKGNKLFDAASTYWNRARSMEIDTTTPTNSSTSTSTSSSTIDEDDDHDDGLIFPTYDEAVYLRWIADRVTRRGHVPKSWPS